MLTLMAIVTGCLYAAGTYMILRRSLFKLILGLVLLSHGANLLIFTVGGLTRGHTPVIEAGKEVPNAPWADPVPQALILTAIVISFAVLAFSLTLFHRAYQTLGSDDPDALKLSDQ
jgi:multicomponent Na+:H+ antiporter subunit C